MQFPPPLHSIHRGIVGSEALKLDGAHVDNTHMSDLSNLLGDVYGYQTQPDGPPLRHEPPAAERAPEWASDSKLERAFADWQPEARYPLSSPAEPDGGNNDLAAALSAALSETVTPPQDAPAPLPPAPAAPAPAAPAPAAAPAAWAATAPIPASMPPAPAAAHTATVTVPAPRVDCTWAHGDDDIFPKGRGGKNKKDKKAKKS